jgi:hypothetical protein
MKVKQAIELLQELPLDAEICAQWYEKEDLIGCTVEPMSDELWHEALRIMEKWECSELRELLEEAIYKAKNNLTTKGN